LPKRLDLVGRRGRLGEMIAMGLIAMLVAIGGQGLLHMLGAHKPFGIAIGLGLVVVALGGLRRSYEPGALDGRAQVTKSGAYVCAAVLALIAIVAPARWVFGSCIVATEAALVFDIITVAARARAAGGT
jgi:hypothetical protein